MINLDKDFVEQMMLGTALGDGHIGKTISGKYTLGCTQAIWEYDYIKFKYDLCKKYFSVCKLSEAHNNTYAFNFSTKSSNFSKSIYEKTRNSDGTRKLPSIDDITPIVLLFWFLDDGSLSLGEQKRPGRKSSICRKLRFHVQSYEDSDIERFVKELNAKFNLNFVPRYEKVRSGKKTIVSIGTNNTIDHITKFLDIILPYKDIIPSCMHYKFCLGFVPTLMNQNMDYTKYNNCNMHETGICTCREKDLSECVNWKIVNKLIGSTTNTSNVDGSTEL